MTARLRKQLQLVKSGTIITQKFNTYLATVGESGFIDPLDTKTLRRATELLTRKPVGNRSGAFHPSSFHRCPREQVFSYLGVPERERVNSGLQHVFNDGHWRHIRWQIALLQAGLLDKVEVSVRERKHHLAGHLDGLLTGSYTFELKGIHGMQFKYILDEPKPEHSDQVEAYFMITGYDTGVILYEDKSSNNWHEHVVHPDVPRRRRLKALIEYLNECLITRTLPPMLDDCRARKGPVYRDCSYAYLCHRSNFDTAEEAATQGTPEAAVAVTIAARPVRLRVRRTSNGA